MKSGNWYFDINHKMFLKFHSFNGQDYSFINPLGGGKKFLFWSFNPYHEFVRQVTDDEIKRYELI